ncbi:MAG: phosphate ABC transporter substrate-binding protein PstS [Thermoplasmata archaeon]
MSINQAGTNAPTSSQSDSTMMQRKKGGRGALIAVIAVVVVVLIVVVGYSAGWFKTSTSGTTGSGCTLPASEPVNGAGSTLVAPLMFQWEAAYTASSVSYNSIGSGGGIAQITAKTVDYGASDAPLSAAQAAAVPSPGVLTIPESIGGVVPIYNLPGLSATLHFTGQILAEIYLGTMTNWNNSALQTINPGVVLPNAAIVVVHRSDGSGTTFIWTSYLTVENATWASTVGHATSVNWPVGVGSKGNAGVTATVKTTSDAIGYVDINYALTDSVAFGAVENPSDNYVLANITNIASAVTDSNPAFPADTNTQAWYNFSVLNAAGAHDYPISSFTYVFVYADLGAAYGASYTKVDAQNLVDFLAWIVSAHDGQSYSAELYYVPLSAAAISYDLAAIDSITYNGGALTPCIPS